MENVSQILSAVNQGDPGAAEQLLPLVYDELRKLAAQKLAHETPGQTLQPTGGDVVITGPGAKEIRLKPGNYKVEASKDGKVVRRELVSVTRNGRQVVRISNETGRLTAADVWEKSVAAEVLTRAQARLLDGYLLLSRSSDGLNGALDDFRRLGAEVPPSGPVLRQRRHSDAGPGQRLAPAGPYPVAQRHGRVERRVTHVIRKRT
jgi:hypothetical protein